MAKIKALREKLRAGLEHPVCTLAIVVLIIVNAMVLGLETYPSVMRLFGPQLMALDQALLSVFVIELALRLLAQGPRFLRDPWNLFDTIVVAVALLPASAAFSVLRALRVLRVLRLISVFPSLRRVIGGIVAALPGIGSIAAILFIFYYVSAVMATKLFGATYPHWFGSLEASLFSLFQIMTLEGWADMTRELAQTHSLAIPFMVVFIVVATFTVLNLFISVMLDAMQRVNASPTMPNTSLEQVNIETLMAETAALRQQVTAIAAKLNTRRDRRFFQNSRRTKGTRQFSSLRR
ncbi:ion transporter [Asticcacaulis sp. AC402]|uniref:ion transporter n=1 Tax=Asticcacaulis sp. AC402 TaxID=1282361 RepID=UPI0003C3ECE4|nr:ion transporter [Asticcacaulis sp. AC402]ESQ76079.1 hypothetical protein ABAC402_06430 [Asticcacaulis sp. AC402]